MMGSNDPERRETDKPTLPVLDDGDLSYLTRRERERLGKEADRLDPCSGIGKAWGCCRLLPQPFTLVQLTLACWSQYRDTFGMRGAPEHPSDHRTRCCLYGPRGLLARGLVRGDGTGNYETMI